MKALVIIPAYNEADIIKKVVDNLMLNYPQFDYVVINDCSTDKTLEVLKVNNYNYINLPINLGIGGAVQTGYIYALQEGYDIAIQIDGYGQHDPVYLDPAVQLIKDGVADIIIGSRFIKREGFQSDSLRRFGIHFLSFLIRLVCGAKVKDVTSGYRIVNAQFIEIYSRNYAQDYPEPEAIVLAQFQGAKIMEIPVIMNSRESGKSSISAIKSIYYMAKVSLSILIYRLSLKKGGRTL